MSALLKTLFGDAGTVAVVAVVVGAELGLIGSREVAAAPFAVPALVLVGVAWLARR